MMKYRLIGPKKGFLPYLLIEKFLPRIVTKDGSVVDLIRTKEVEIIIKEYSGKRKVKK